MPLYIFIKTHHSPNKDVALANYSNRVVCFLDILGFTDLFVRSGRDQEGNPNTTLYDQVLSAFEEVVAGAASKKSYLEEKNVLPQGSVDITYFSDSVVISCSRTTHGAEGRVLQRAGTLARQLLLRGLASRGGIDYGVTYHKQGIVFGEGMFRAYYLESKVANFPRIVVSEEVGSTLKRKVRGTGARFVLSKSEGGLYYLNIFKLAGGKGSTTNQLRSIAQAIGTGLWEARKSGRPDIVAKWFWLREECNKEIRGLNKRAKGSLAIIPVEGIAPE